ncbi:MAG: hypothetical protein HGA45_43575 [Chloroflexales bacterium]|nr:hypothetical protein [Chloroflexales bacterium]
MLPKHLTTHLADTVFEDLAEIARRCRHWGLHADEADGQITLIAPWPGGITGGLAEGTDPIGRAVILGLVLFGPLWPHVAPDLLDQVRQRWRAERQGQLGVKYLP